MPNQENVLEFIAIPEPKPHGFSVNPARGKLIYLPSKSQDPKHLFTMAYVQLIEELTDLLFPPRHASDSKKCKYLLKASDTRVERYILLRSMWHTKEFAEPLFIALYKFNVYCLNHYQKHFVELEKTDKETVVKAFFNASGGMELVISTIHEAIREGVFADPGYGGNHKGIGWYYANFMEVGA